MYTEENARGRFPLRDILLKAIVVIIFIILIIFIITKLTTPTSSNKKSSSDYDKVFSANLDAMENAAFDYFTKDRLPKEVGDNTELTLREMVNSNLLEAFTDADGKSCDVNKSYIRLTKNDDDYTLRVNLKCADKEDYSLQKVGEYSYCDKTICKRDSSKEEDNKKNKETEVTKKVDITEDTTSDNESTNNKNSSNNNTSSGSSNNSSSNNSSSNNAVNSQPEVPKQSQKITMYEYRKVTNPTFSSWTSWSSWARNSNRYSAIKCSDTDVNCLREIQLYSRKEKVGTADGKAVYATVHYYSTRTRTLLSSGSTDIKWSTYNDTNLLNQGYTYTGNTR